MVLERRENKDLKGKGFGKDTFLEIVWDIQKGNESLEKYMRKAVVPIYFLLLVQTAISIVDMCLKLNVF